MTTYIHTKVHSSIPFQYFSDISYRLHDPDNRRLVIADPADNSI